MQSILFKKKETKIFSKGRSHPHNNKSKFVNFTLIMGKILFEITLALFIGTIFIIYNINPSQAQPPRILTIVDKKGIINQHYSGLIVYIKGNQNFHRSMAPRLISRTGKSVYCNLNRLSIIQYNFLVNSGIATFTKNISEAKKRAGSNPLIVQAVETVNSDTAIISDKTALEILRANHQSRFLDNFKVSFILND